MDYILNFGGRDSSNFSKAVDIFKVTEDGVIKVEDRVLELSVARNDLAAASAGNYVFAMGGFYGEFSRSNAVDVFEVTESGVEKVTGLGIALDSARSHLAAASAGNCVFAMGGHGTYDPSNSVDIFKVTESEVKKLNSLTLSSARTELAAASAGNYVLAMGGYDGSNYSKAVDIFKVTEDGVIKVEDRGLELSVARYNLAAAASGDYILAMGGYDGSNYSKAVDIFKVTEDGVIKVEDRVLELSVARNDLAAASVGDYILAMGGYDGSSYSKAVDVFFNKY